MGDLPDFFPVWYNKKSMINILSFTEVRKKFRLSANTDIATAMNVHLHNGFMIVFIEVALGLYILKGNSLHTQLHFPQISG